MKSYRKELWFEVPNRRGFINITPQVNECLRESKIQEGFVLCNAMHITASVFINDDEAGLHHDYDVWLEKLAPHAVKGLLPSPEADSTLEHGNRFSMESLTVGGASVSSSR